MGEFRRDRGRKDFRRNDFRRDKPMGGSSRRGRDSGRRAEMHTVVCDKCGKECEVPFNPTEGKPVYCSDCFRKNDSAPRRESSRRDDAPRRSEDSPRSVSSSSDLKEINQKLDKIISILEQFEVVENEASDDDDQDSDDDKDSEDGHKETD